MIKNHTQKQKIGGHLGPHGSKIDLQTKNMVLKPRDLKIQQLENELVECKNANNALERHSRESNLRLFNVKKKLMKNQKNT